MTGGSVNELHPRVQGYENEDWFIQTPTIPPDEDLDLSPDVIEETLRYFVLCSDRLSQMTKTYNDIDAITRLLEEKERDLELAARIGQSLLEQNKELRQRNEQLEQELTIANDTEQRLNKEIVAAAEGVTQLKHELALKNGLLQIYTQDLDTDSEASSPSDKSLAVNWEVINRKIQNLQEENMQLRNEAVVRTIDIENEEKKEMQLINDCVRQLAEANLQISSLQEEISRKTDDSVRQQEEITQLLSQVVDLQRRVRDLTADNEILQNKVQIAEECQQELSTELIEIKEKYEELLIALQELQEEAKKARHSRMPKASKWTHGAYTPYINPDSLASELESTLSQHNGYSSDEKSVRNKKVFDTVRCANYPGVSHPRRRSNSQSLYTQSPSRFSVRSTYSSLSQLSSASSCNESQTSDSESAYAETDEDYHYPAVSRQDKLGLPGSNSIDVALRRFSSGIGTATDLSSEDGMTPARCWTPESTVSISSNKTGASGRSGFRHYHMPEKLQIIKPLEGSQTLHHWQRLATPHLGGIFESRPGVQIKGEIKLEGEDEIYTLSDFEEDEEFCHPGKSFMGTSSVYTYTNSTILHPCEQTQVTPSYPSLQMSIQAGSQPPSSLNSPQQQQRERATSTFSTTLGLAKLLNERGIYAMVPTAVTSREEVAPTPPTPAPSPEGSPPPTPPPFSAVQVPDLISSGSLARGLHLLRRSQSKRKSKSVTCARGPTTSSTVESQPLKFGLLEKLNRIGLEHIMSTTASQVPPSIAEMTGSRYSRLFVKMKTISENSSLTLTPKTDVGVKTRVDLSSFTTLSPSIKKTQNAENSKRSQNTENSPNVSSWGYVPPSELGKSQVVTDTVPSVVPAVSCLPKPWLQLNNLHNLPKDKNSNMGTIGALRTLRKGGYI